MRLIDSIARKLGPAAVAVVTITFSVSSAGAVSPAVREACKADYLSFCSAHPVGSSALRSCMSASGPKLSKGCVNALIAAGEVSRAEVKRRAAKLR